MRLVNVLGLGRRAQTPKINNVPSTVVAQPASHSFVFQAKVFLVGIVALGIMLSIESSEKQLMTAFGVGAMVSITRWARSENLAHTLVSAFFTIFCIGMFLTIAFGI